MGKLQTKSESSSGKLADGTADAIESLAKLADLPRGWDGYDAEPPSASAVSHAKSFLAVATGSGIVPGRIVPSVVGGVGMTFRADSRKAYVEFFNDGEIYVLFSDGVSEPSTRPVRAENRGFEALIAEISQYLNA